MDDFKIWYFNMPPFTRYGMTVAIAVSAVCSFHLINAYSLALFIEKIFEF